MTSQEARQQLDSCENQITGTYSNLCDAARSMGSSAAKAASSKTTRSTVFPLIISLFGIILCFQYNLLDGVILIIVGVVIAYKTSQSAASVQKSVEQQVGYLNDTLDSNSKI